MSQYNYSEYNNFNRFINIDGIEGKIIQHMIFSETKYAEYFWKILKYDTKDALMKPNLTIQEKVELIDGYNNNIKGGQTEMTRVFFSPFSDDAWEKECSSVYIYVDNIYPIDHTRSTISLTVETVMHSKINAIYGDADFEANPEFTNPNDYFFKDPTNPAVQFKSRATVLMKCILAEINGLYIDGVGYVEFNHNKALNSEEIKGKATMSVFNSRSFFGHAIQFNIGMSGVSLNTFNGF